MAEKNISYFSVLIVLFGFFSNAHSDQLNSTDAVWSQRVVQQVGVNIHLSFYDTPYKKFNEIVLPALSELGVIYLRDVFPKNNHFNKLYISRLKHLCDIGYRFSLVVFDETNPNYTVDYTTASYFINSLAGCIHILEGVNEPNLKSNKNWAAITTNSQRRLFEFINNTKFEVKQPYVAGPSLWGDSAQAIGDLSSVVDIGNWHTYSGGRNPESGQDKDGSIFNYLQQAEKIFGNKKILVSEDGYHSAMDAPINKHRPTPNEVIATYLPRLILLHRDLGVYQTYIYELIDTKNNGSSDPESNFGLVDYEGKRKPQFNALKNLIKIFSDYSDVSCNLDDLFSIKYSVAEDIKIQLFCKSNGKWLIGIWRPLPIWDPVSREHISVESIPVKLSFPDRSNKEFKVTQIDRFGNANVQEHRANKSGELIVDANETVSIIEFSMQ